jgi:hypothetical protein
MHRSWINAAGFADAFEVSFDGFRLVCWPARPAPRCSRSAARYRGAARCALRRFRLNFRDRTTIAGELGNLRGAVAEHGGQFFMVVDLP